eukprot:265864-Chlamydomonas_euryale.AAC.1
MHPHRLCVTLALAGYAPARAVCKPPTTTHCTHCALSTHPLEGCTAPTVWSHTRCADCALLLPHFHYLTRSRSLRCGSVTSAPST